MLKKNEFSSTEKLLKLIRSDQDVDAASAPDQSNENVDLVDEGQKKASLLQFSSSAKSNISIGVYIGYQSITMVKVDRSRSKKPKIIDHLRTPFNKKIDTESDEFQAFLREKLQKFCEASGNAQVWTAIHASDVEIQRFQIPNVPKKHLTKTVLWSLKKHLKTDSRFENEEYVFDFELHEKRSAEDSANKIPVTACLVAKAKVKEVQKLFVKCGFPLVGISIEPLAVQNLLRCDWLPDDAITCNLHIGDEKSRIDLYRHGSLVLTREINTGVDSMIEALVDRMGIDLGQGDVHSVELSLSDSEIASEPVIEEGVDENLLHEAKHYTRRILFSLCGGELTLTQDEKQKGYIVPDEDKILKFLNPVILRLVRQINSTIEHYVTPGSSDTVTMISLSGEVSTSEKIVASFGNMLSYPCSTLHANLKTEGDTAVEQQISQSAHGYFSLGMALFDYRETLNLLYTYKEKERQARSKVIDHWIFGAFISVVLLSGVYYTWQEQVILNKTQEVADLKKELIKYAPEPDRDTVKALADKLIEQRKKDVEYSDRYRTMAIVSELIKLTPYEVALKNMVVNVKQAQSSKEGEKNKKARGKESGDVSGESSVEIEGIISGDRSVLSSYLAGYLVKLKNSALFGTPRVLKSHVEENRFQGRLRFSLKLPVEK